MKKLFLLPLALLLLTGRSAAVQNPTLTLHTRSGKALAEGQPDFVLWLANGVTGLSCMKSGSWSGIVNTSGSSPVTPSVGASYSMDCSGINGSQVCATINLGQSSVAGARCNAPPPPPSPGSKAGPPSTPPGGWPAAPTWTQRYGLNLITVCYAQVMMNLGYPQDLKTGGRQDLDLANFAADGLTLFRVNFEWEYAQPVLMGPLNPQWVDCMRKLVGLARSHGAVLDIEPHNYDRYECAGDAAPCAAAQGGATGESVIGGGDGYVIGSPQVPYAAFRDFWAKLAAALKGNQDVLWYDLMNEPYNTQPYSWPIAAQQAIWGIRSADPATTIVIPGHHWSNCQYFHRYNAYPIASDPTDGGPAGDPAGNAIYQCHQYWDGDGGQHYGAPGGTPLNVGESDMDGAGYSFVPWLEAAHAKGYVGEFGIPSPAANPNTRAWQPYLANFLQYLNSVCMSGTIFWGGYMVDVIGQAKNIFTIDPGSPTLATLIANPARGCPLGP
jgi:hypothetical protein